MSDKYKKTLAALLVAVLTVTALFPLRASAASLPCQEWEGDFETIDPVGDAPWAKVRLTPSGAEFTEWYLPERYEVVFKDGSRRIVSAENCEERAVEGVEGREPMVGFSFDAEINGETFTFFAEMWYYERAQQCTFEVGHEGTAVYEDGQMKSFRHCVSRDVCDTAVDKGNVFNYLAHKMYYLFWEIIYFFMNL